MAPHNSPNPNPSPTPTPAPYPYPCVQAAKPFSRRNISQCLSPPLSRSGTYTSLLYRPISHANPLPSPCICVCFWVCVVFVSPKPLNETPIPYQVACPSAVAAHDDTCGQDSLEIASF